LHTIVLDSPGVCPQSTGQEGAIHAFIEALASNLLDNGVRVNAVAPGPVCTPLNPADSSPARIKPSARAPQPEALSPACASSITGIARPITGRVGA
jgi:NAD(P)-dependent dehydrogenase (short-subunit alcohol dehydrogenase family)